MTLKSSITQIGTDKVEILTRSASKPKATVIFIHGFPFNQSIWKDQLNALPENILGIAYNIRGYGKSSKGHGFFSIDLFARDVIALIDELKLKNVVLCGISMGGYIALRATEIVPKKIAGLILCDTTSSPDTNDAKLARFEGIDAINTKGKDVYADNFIKKIFSDHTLSNNPEIVESIRKVIVSNKAATICGTLLALASRTDTTDSLKNIKVPALVIRGEDDKIISKEMADSLMKNIKGAKLETITLSGHLPNLENKEEFNRVMNGFFESLT